MLLRKRLFPVCSLARIPTPSPRSATAKTNNQKCISLAESGEHGVSDPCEGCTPEAKIAILAESGEHGVRDPCEGCTPERKIAILAEGGEHGVRDPGEGCTIAKTTTAILAVAALL